MSSSSGGRTPPPAFPPPGGHEPSSGFPPPGGDEPPFTPPPTSSGPDAWGAGGSEPDGPPPPPWERRRRSRRRGWLVAAVVLVVLGVPIGLAVAGALSDDDDPIATDDDPDVTDPEDGTDDGTDGPAPDADAPDVAPPDVDELSGSDAVYGQLLVDIDESERAMIAFQDEIQAAFLGRGGEGDDLVEALRGAAGTGVVALDAVRGRLAEPIDEPPAAAIRDVYVEHLDAWMRFMEAVEEDPALLGRETDSARFTLAINTSAEAFARALETELPGDVDAEVQEFADGILDRGFRSESGPDV